jgi:hypothetical protein
MRLIMPFVAAALTLSVHPAASQLPPPPACPATTQVENTTVARAWHEDVINRRNVASATLCITVTALPSSLCTNCREPGRGRGSALEFILCGAHTGAEFEGTNMPLGREGTNRGASWRPSRKLEHVARRQWQSDPKVEAMITLGLPLHGRPSRQFRSRALVTSIIPARQRYGLVTRQRRRKSVLSTPCPQSARHRG